MYASNAGKSGGEFFTPQEVSELLAEITVVGKKQVNKVYDPACGSGAFLNQALDLIQNSIISHGYVTTRMLLPQQNIASGEIKLQVIAGKVDQIQFVQETSKRAHKFNALPVRSGDILNIQDIEQGLENFKRVPTVEADFKIKPSEQRNQPGYSDLELGRQQTKPYRIHLGVDDTGSDSTGKSQSTATLSLDHLFTDVC